MSQFHRVREGSQLAGICSGFEAVDKGSALLWRLVFVIGTAFTLFPALIYFAMAVMVPQVRTKAEAKKNAGIEAVPGAIALTGIESNLDRLTEMRKKGLITPEEFAQLRKRELGLG